MTSPAPVSLDEVLSPAWLTDALGVRVDEVEVVETIKTVATKVRFVIHTPLGDQALCAKGLLDGVIPPPGRARMSEAETRFYREVQPTAGVNTPVCRYAALDETTGHGIVVMDDVVAAGGRFLTALEPYSPEQAASSIEQLASLHAHHWDGAGLDRFPWLTSRVEQFVSAPLRGVDELQAQLDDGRSEPLPVALADAGRIIRALTALAARTADRPVTLVHGDAHAGNLFVLDGRTSLIDWQVLQRTSWAIDVAYHVNAALAVEDRRASERELLDHYLDRLTALGAAPPSREEAWQLYRESIAYGFYLWVITREVARPITLEFVRRLGTAVADHGTFELLGV